jgi:hypothetical protein
MEGLLFEAVLLLMSASKWKPEIRGAGNGKGESKGRWRPLQGTAS